MPAPMTLTPLETLTDDDHVAEPPGTRIVSPFSAELIALWTDELEASAAVIVAPLALPPVVRIMITKGTIPNRIPFRPIRIDFIFSNTGTTYAVWMKLGYSQRNRGIPLEHAG